MTHRLPFYIVVSLVNMCVCHLYNKPTYLLTYLLTYLKSPSSRGLSAIAELGLLVIPPVVKIPVVKSGVITCRVVDGSQKVLAIKNCVVSER